MQATPYVHASSASGLASETRNISISSTVVNAINSFIDELLFNVLANLTGASTSSSIKLPVKTASLKDAFLNATTKSPAIAREAVLEAEIQQREWIKLKGKSSDSALPATGGPGNLSRKTSASLLETIPANREWQTDSNTCLLDELFSDLKNGLEQLSQLGRRAGLSSTPNARITAAINVKARGISKHASPMLLLYSSAIITYLATYIIKGCGRVVEQDSGSSVAALETLLEFIGEDQQLSELWNSMHVKTVVDRELALSTYSSPFLGSNTTVVQQRSSDSNSSRNLSLPGERSMPAAAGGTTSRKLSFRRKGNTSHIVSSSHKNVRGVLSMDPHRGRSGSAATQETILPVSSIPFKTSPPPTGNAAGSMQRKRDHSTSSFDAEGTAKLPDGTLAFLEYGEEDLPPRQNSLQSKTHLGGSSTSQQSAAATQLDGIDFESLISGGQTRKLSLTPTRFALTGNNTVSYSLSAAGAKLALNRARAQTRQASASKASEETMFARPQRGGKMQARTARPVASGLGIADDTSSGDEDKELLEDWDEEDEAIFGPRKPKKTAKKQTLLDMLNSDPPWAGPAPSPPPGSAQNSKASKMLGGDAGRLAPFGHPSSSSSASLPTLQQTRKFSPIANLDVAAAPALLRPTTANSLPSSIRPSTAGSALDAQALNDFPIPPERKSPPTLTSHKSSPNLSYGASSSSFAPSASSEDVLSRPMQPMRRKLVAKDERAARAERHDDLIAFLQDAPPPPPTTSYGNSAADLDSSTSPSLSSASSRTRLGSGKFRQFLSSGRRPSLPAIPASYEESSIDELGRLQRSTPPTSSSRKLSKMTGIMSPASGGSRHFSSRSHSNSVSSAEAFKAEMEIAAMDKEIARKQQYKEDEAAQKEYQNIFSKLHSRQASHPSSSAMLPQQQRQDVTATAMLPSSPSRPFATTVAVPYSFGQRVYSKQIPALQSQPSYSSSIENRVAAPLLTPEHSKDDLYSMTKPIMAHTTSIPLDTPPATPYDKRPPVSTYQLSSERISQPLMRRSTSPIPSMSQTHDQSKASRRTSLIKRKAPPKADVEDLLEARASMAEEPLVARQREASAASTASIVAASAHTEPASRSREASASSSFVSMSSSSSASSNITSRIFTLPTQQQQQPIERVLEASEASRPASTVILPLPPRSSSSFSRLGTGNNTTEVHRILLSLRNSMVTAADVNECLTLVDAAMFEVAYDIQSAPYDTSTIAEESEDAAEEMFARESVRPVFYSSQVANRAYLALLEWLMLEEEGRTIVYPRGFHRSAATRTFSDLGPFSSSSKITQGPTLSSHEMAKEPSLGYSMYESAESESDEVGTPRLGVGRDSQDMEEILQAAVVKA